MSLIKKILDLGDVPHLSNTLNIAQHNKGKWNIAYNLLLCHVLWLVYKINNTLSWKNYSILIGSNVTPVQITTKICKVSTDTLRLAMVIRGISKVIEVHLKLSEGRRR